MQSKPTHDQEVLHAWREQGADRMDPLAFHYMAALQCRIVDHDGDARLVLEKKLSARISAYAANLEQATSKVAEIDKATSSATLGELVNELSQRAAVRNNRAATADTAPSSAFPELGALHDLRKLWASVRTDSQVRRSLQHSPTNVGPLNSSSLVHRSLTLMREVSPGYLQQFLSYVDALSWMEHLNDHGVLAAKGARPPASGRARARSRPRKRRE